MVYYANAGQSTGPGPDQIKQIPEVMDVIDRLYAGKVPIRGRASSTDRIGISEDCERCLDVAEIDLQSRWHTGGVELIEGFEARIVR